MGTEFVGTSTTSRLRCQDERTITAARPENPHVKFFDGRPGGYVYCSIDAERWKSDLRLAESVRDPRSSVGTIASFVVENGRPDATRA